MSPTPRRVLIGCLVLVAAVCVRLGFWQVGRLEERRAANRAALAAREAPVVTLDGGAAADVAGLANRRVEVTGRYDHDHEIMLRGQSLQGVPGVVVVTPLRFRGSDNAVLVSRGFVPAPDAVSAEVASLREPGEVRVAGIALPLPSGDGKPLERGGRTTWGALDRQALAARLPYPILPLYIRQSPDSSLPNFPRRLPLPALDDGPHLSYAVQWFFFAGMALVFAGVVVARSR